MSEPPEDAAAAPRASIIIPAHNEERSIGRLLAALRSDDAPGEFQIVVVCNACTDATAAIARAAGPSLRVLELPEPGKHNALKAGDAETDVFPRVYIDADVEISVDGVRALCDALQAGAMAAAPERQIPLDRSSPLVRAYYAVWMRLPQVRSGLFGRGVVAVSRAGSDRIQRLPPVMSDDLAMSEAFSDAERAIVPGAVVIVRPPRTFRDLLRRRTRAIIGNTQLDLTGGRSAETKTSWAVLGGIAQAEPSVGVCVPVFVAVAALAKLSARRAVRNADYSSWHRDESSRAPLS